MKLRRCVVIGMLTTTALSPLVGAGWWWITLAERTAREFWTLAATDRWEETQRLIEWNSKLLPRTIDDPESRPNVTDVARDGRIAPVPRSVVDEILGRQAFVGVKPTVSDLAEWVEFEIQCGRLTWLNTGAGNSSISELVSTYLPTWKIRFEVDPSTAHNDYGRANRKVVP